MIRVHIRWMIRRDMIEVLAMEEELFSYEGWSEEQFLTVLRQRTCIAMVAEAPDGQVLGCMIYELHKDGLTLLRLCVHPKYNRQGVATALLRKLQGKLSGHRRTWIKADAPDSQLGLHLCLRRNGFLAVAVDGMLYKFEYNIPVLEPELGVCD